MVSETEFNELIELLRDFIRREVMPAEASIDETDEIPARLIAQAGFRAFAIDPRRLTRRARLRPDGSIQHEGHTAALEPGPPSQIGQRQNQQ